jgi:hypothetical protein
MIKNIIGAVVGAKLAGKTPKANSAAGATTGAIAAPAIPFVISRLSLPSLIAIGAGSYLLKRHHEKQAAARNPLAGGTTA